ncbi:MAG: fibronectin type III domain-containing protein, partial [Ilumatobacter sp.]|nr:fibronectin type III domain-containing protein [Ilumatobacter sp.]
MFSSLLAAVTVVGGIVASDVSPTFAVAEPPTPHLVGDLERAGVDSGPRDFVGLGDVVVFAARDQEVGSELWRYDTSDGNVTLLTDIVPGPEGSNPDGLVVFDDAVYFSARDEEHGTELWRTDGTLGGTKMVADISPGQRSSLPRDFIEFDDALYFTARTPATGIELWRTDGDSVELVADILAGSSGSDPTPLGVVEVDDGLSALYLRADTETRGVEVVRYDEKYGITEFDIAPGAADAHPTTPAVFGDSLVVVAGPLSSNRALWRLTGADATTLVPVDMNVADVPVGVVATDDQMFVRTTDGYVSDLIVYDDVTDSPTTLLDDTDVTSVTAFGDGVLFGHDGGDGREPWFSGGTLGSTFQLADVAPGAGASNPGTFWPDPGSGTAVFAANIGDVRDLWRTDGTPGGTFPLTGEGEDDPWDVALVGPSLWAFSNDDGVSGTEPWITEGTRGSTQPIAEIDDANEGSWPTGFARLGDGVLFTTGSAMWRSASHDEVPAVVAELESPTYAEPVSLGDRVVFMSHDPVNSYEPWVTDGTLAGTSLIGNITPGATFAAVDDVIGAIGTVYFVRRDAGLWATNGRPGDLRQVFSGEVRDAVAVGSDLYFQGITDPTGAEPYVSDGTVAGTRLLADLDHGEAWSNPQWFTSFDGFVYFVADGLLWRTAGLPGDVVEVPVPATADRVIEGIGAGAALFVWQVSLLDSAPRLLTSADPMTGFTELDRGGLAIDGVSTDLIRRGEVGSIVPVSLDGSKDANAVLGIVGASATLLYEAGESEYVNRSEYVDYLDHVYFVVEQDDYLRGRRLIQTDGTVAGTHVVDATEPTDGAHELDQLALVGDILYYSKSTQQFGVEPFLIDVGAGVPTAPTGVSAVAGDGSAVVSWASPADDGGAPIVSYSVTASPGGASCTTSSLSCTVSGLVAGTSYTFTVRADNGRYSSAASTPSNAVVPTGFAGFVPLAPARLLESRSGPLDVTVDGSFEGI